MKLYKMQIVYVPPASLKRVPEINVAPGDEYDVLVHDSRYRPEGWVEYLDEAAARGKGWAIDATANDYEFFWPSESKTYLTKAAAMSKKRAVERWGGKARVLVAEVGEFVDVEDLERSRLAAQLAAKESKLRERAEKIQEQFRELNRQRKDAGIDV